MPKIILAASLVAAFALAACGSPAQSPIGQVPPSAVAPASPSVQPSPSGVPVVTPSPSADPTAAPTPRPTVRPTPKPTPKPLVPNTREKYLIAGVNRGAIDCKPVRTGLPTRAIAGIECGADDRAVAKVGFYLFKSDRDTLDAYLQRMKAEGVKLDSGGCIAGEGEGDSAYIPWEGPGIAPWRNGCFVNDAGYGNFRATLPGSHVYIGVLGRTANMAALADFAWKFSQDTPGTPTLWAEAGP